jgi:hypothetical protein
VDGTQGRTRKTGGEKVKSTHEEIYMTRSTRAIGIVLTLALTLAGQTGCATIAHSPTSQAPAKNVEALPSMSGKVVETMNVASYTYLCLEENGTKTWFAVPLTKVTAGQELAVRPGFEMVNFKSRELNRTFGKIIFSDGLVVKRDAAGTETMKHAYGEKSAGDFSGSLPASAANAPVAESCKAGMTAGTNTFTVAELYKKRGMLDKKKVVVKAKVVKVTKGIMGKNWVHLSDGTGDASHHTNELVVTTQDNPSVGDVVTANGTICKDKDFGAGYKYDLIMEEASVRKELPHG